MSKIPKDNSFQKPVNKNIKNIYVHKINSLMKISRDNLAQDEVDVLTNNKGHEKKIKKVYSEIDKISLKLQKNRESARKARQRKNLYIKLLQSQVIFLKKQLAESEAVENSSHSCLKKIRNSQKPSHSTAPLSTVEDDLDRYISQDDLQKIDESKQRDKKKIKMIDAVTNEFQYWFVPGLLKSIMNLKKSQRSELNSKLLKSAQAEFEKGIKDSLLPKQSQIRLLLPFEQQDPTLKITNLVKTLSKSTQQINMTLEKLSELKKQIRQLIGNQEICDLQMNQVIKNRIKSIITELKLCPIGDRPQKIIQRIIRWEQFPQINMIQIMHKIIEFNKFIENIYVEVEQIKQKEDSEMSEEKQTDKPRN